MKDVMDSQLPQLIPILTYRDVGSVHDELVDVFGLRPGPKTHGPGDAVGHAEVFVGNRPIWLHPESADYRLASPSSLGGATASTAILVADVDEHHRAVQARGGDISYPPTDQPYGYREYSVRDREGGLWSFMQALPAGAAPDGRGDEEAVVTFLHRWAEAIVANDTEQMERFVTDDWVLVDGPGVITRETFHAVVASGELRHTSMVHEVLGITRLGPDHAVIRSRGRNTGTFLGEAIEADEWTTNVLTRRPDGWRCLLTQLTPAGTTEAEPA